MSNACGLVTSWTRWRPMKSCVWPVGSRRTVCASQTFCRSVAAIRGWYHGRWAEEAGGWRLEVGGWRLEAGGWRLEAGGWRLEAGGWEVAGIATCSANEHLLQRDPRFVRD